LNVPVARRKIQLAAMIEGLASLLPAAAATMAPRRHLASLTMLVPALLLASGLAGAEATTDTASRPSGVAPAATVADIVTQANASAALLRAAQAQLEQAGKWRDMAGRTSALEAGLEDLSADASSRIGLIGLTSLDRQLRVLRSEVATGVDGLASIARQIEREGDALESDARKWQERAAQMEERHVPAPLIESARSIEAKLGHAGARLQASRDDVLLALSRALALQTRIDDVRASVAAQGERIRAQRLQLEESSLLQLGAAHETFDFVAAELGAAWRMLRGYFAQHGPGLAALFLGMLAFNKWLFTRRKPQDPALAQCAYGRPGAASLLVALMALWWLAADPPVIFYELLLALTPIPAAMVARRTFGAHIPLTIYGLAFATVLLPVRITIEAGVVADRILLLLQALSVGVPLAIDLRLGRLQKALPRWSPGAVRAVALVVIAVSVVTVLNVILGFSGPGKTLREGTGSILGFSLVFGATAQAVYWAVLALFESPLFRWLRSARNADPSLLRAVRLVLGLLAVVGVGFIALGGFGLLSRAHLALDSLLGATLDLGAVEIPASAIATALGVALATYIVTVVTGFILDREIVPRLKMRPGAGFAVVTFTRWMIVIVGSILTLAALGIDMAKVTLVASAVGVGIGFGLQNIVNNFVSGLILIVERPVGVGDQIEIGPMSGDVKRIGIRSSTVRTSQGADVIVPNSELVSKQVVNWTRTDRRRRYEIDVGVAYGSEPEQVMRLLAEAASEVPEVMVNPAPRAMFQGFGEHSLDFRLLAWVHDLDVGFQAQNALRIAILRKFEKAGIVIPFPIRDA
jgi:potassium efflux system protein